MTTDVREIVAQLKGHSEIMERDKGKFVRFIDVATCTEAVDVIEAQAAEIEELKSWKAAEDAHHHAMRAEIKRLERTNYCTGCKARQDTLEAQAAEIERLREAIERQASAIRTLHANEQTEINTLRKKRHEWHHAVSSLDSEREANALLTAEIERLTAERDAAVAEVGQIVAWLRAGGIYANGHGGPSTHAMFRNVADAIADGAHKQEKQR